MICMEPLSHRRYSDFCNLKSVLPELFLHFTCITRGKNLALLWEIQLPVSALASCLQAESEMLAADCEDNAKATLKQHGPQGYNFFKVSGMVSDYLKFFVNIHIPVLLVLTQQQHLICVQMYVCVCVCIWTEFTTNFKSRNKKHYQISRSIKT